MKSLRLALALTAFTIAAPAAAQSGAVPPLVRTELAPGVYQFTVPADGYVENLNALVAINQDDVLVYDTFTRPSAAEMLVAEIRKLTPKPVRTIVNSHWHPDHWSGNAAIARAWPGVEIIATKATAETMRNVAPAWPVAIPAMVTRFVTEQEAQLAAGKHADGRAMTPADVKQAALDVALANGLAEETRTVERVYPTRTYEGSLSFTRGGREFRLMSMTGDATDESVLYLPKEKILATGDLVVHPVTWTTQSYKIAAWRDNLRALAGMDVKTIVPGHGVALRDSSYVLLVAELFDTVMAQVREGLAKGLVTPEEILPTMRLEALRARFAKGDAALGAVFDGTVRSLVTKTYLEARDGMLSKR